MEGVYGEYYKTLFKDIREGLKNLRAILCSWNRKLRPINISIIHKLLYNFEEIPLKIII